MRIKVIAAMLATIPVAASAAPPTLGARIAADAVVGEGVQAVGADSFATTTVSFPSGVVGMPDRTYATIAGYRPLKLDLLLPPARFAKAGPRPVIVYIHGGGWMGGGPRRSGAFSDWPRVLASVAAQGYVVASVSYRFSSEAPFPAAQKDVKAAIRWLRANAADYNIDKARFVTFGASAGGQLAALTAVSCGVKALEPDARVVPNARTVELAPSAAVDADAQSDCVQGAVIWYGAFDFSTMPDSPVQRAYLGCGPAACSAEAMKAASPVTYIDERDPPMLLMHGDEDSQVPVGQSKSFDAALKAKNVSSTLVLIPQVEHSWIGKSPASTRATSLAALRQSLNFIDVVIGDASVRKR
jgi:acetyl esterase/lipase